MSIKNSATRLAAYAAGAAVTLALAGAVVALPAQAAIMKAQAVQAKAGIGPGQAPAQGGQPLQQQLAA